MEQYKTIDKALQEIREKHEHPVVVEQFTNPKPAEKESGGIRIFVSQALICFAVILVLIVCKFLFPGVYDYINRLIIGNVTL